MIALIQRVSDAEVSVDDPEPGRITGQIGPGVCALIAVERDDTEKNARRLLTRLLGYRIFADDAGRMNRSLADTGGGLLLVPNFTLAADTAKGTRPGFSSARDPEEARELFEKLVNAARQAHGDVAAGVFGAHMRVRLTNDGPVTFRLTA